MLLGSNKDPRTENVAVVSSPFSNCDTYARKAVKTKNTQCTGTMDFFEQHTYDESEAIHRLDMKVNALVQQWGELKPMILAREQAQAMNSYNPWPVHEPLEHSYNSWPINEPYGNSHNQWSSYEPYDNTYNPEWRNHQDFSWSHNEVNTYEQPETEEKLRQLAELEQEDVASIPLYDEDEEAEDEDEETEEKVKEVEDVLFEAPLLYKELKPYVPPITFPSQLEQDDVATFPLKGELVEKEETKEKAKEAEDVPFKKPLLYKELRPYVPPITFLSRLYKRTMDFYEQHAYNEESEAIHRLDMKLNALVKQYGELKPMILAREQAQAMNSYNLWPVHEPFEHSYNS
ncbi:hypothetical protein LWI29_035818 [Acer saccharum]|uniref:Uncharacterized protein n=1 Tax=Acer saccharum TaxID=4024 RepID=A0AA39VCR0_ACESA|nr:hypothetical protein LWI29_035818 [Acer saccharum]